MDSGTELSAAARHGGKILVEALLRHGADRVFCVPGESYLPVLDALHDAPIEVIVARHEGAAANMAVADGKLTGRPGLCLVTRGPGATHASVGVHTAMQDSTPMILFVGQVEQAFLGREAFQEVDYRNMFGGLAKWVTEIDDPAKIPEIIARAYHVAQSGRPGPVVLSLPEDVLFAHAQADAVPPLPPLRLAPDPAALADVARHLAASRRPLLLLGGGDWDTQARADIAAFAAAYDLPVTTAFRRQDLFDNADPHFAGHVGLGLSPALAARVREADLLIALGARLGETTTDGYTLIDPAIASPRPSQTLVHAHADPGELGRVYRPDVAIAASAGPLAAALRALPAPPSPPTWIAWRESLRREFVAFTERPAPSVDGVSMEEAIRTLSDRLPGDAIVCNGAGNYAIWLHRFWRYGGSRRQLAPTSGAMGFGLPAAIAAKRRHPSRTVICLAGDGCFQMYPQELATAVQYGAAVLVLVVNNGMYGTIRMHQERHYPRRRVATDLRNPDFAGLARACGAYGERVDDTASFWPAVQRALAANLPAVLDLRVDPAAITPDRRLAPASPAA